MGISIDGVGGGGFRATGRDGVRGNLATDRGRDWAEMVLSGVEGAEHDMD